MVKWGGLRLRDGMRVFQEGVIQFNDYIIAVGLFVFWFVLVLVVVEVLEGKGGARDAEGGLVLEAV